MKKYILPIIILIIILLLLPKSVPLILAFITAIMFEPMIVAFQKKFHSKRLLPVLIVFIAFLALTGLISFLLVSKLIEQLQYFSKNLPYLLAELNNLITFYLQKWEVFSANIPEDVYNSILESVNSIEQSLLTLTTNITQSLIVFFTSIPQLLLEVLVYFIGLFLFSIDLPKVKRGMVSFFKEETREKILFMYHQLNKAGIGFIKAQLLFSLLTFILSYVGLLLLGVSYPILLSIVIVCVDILPVLGTGSVLVPLSIYFFVTEQTNTGVGLLILFLVITVVRRVIEPKVYSTNMGISPLASLISMYLGFKLIGFLGLILGPTVIIIFDTLRKSGLVKFQIKL